MKIRLASQSPRRKQIFNMLGLPFEINPSYIDETEISLEIDPKEYCKKLAFLKATNISNKFPDDLIISGDTIVVIDKIILNKPKSTKEAIYMLKLLSGNVHQVMTGICIINKSENLVENFVEITEVTFNKISEMEILYYINNHTPFDKAGSYGIQDWSSVFISKINGCFYNVLGFPISKFYYKLNLMN